MQADSYKRLTTLTCHRCNKEYEPTLKRDGTIRYKHHLKACSKWCHFALNKGIAKAEYLSTVPCEHCGTPFKPKKEPYGRALFCSRSCFNNHEGVNKPNERLDLEFRALKKQSDIGKKQIKIILGMVVLRAISKFINIYKNSKPGDRLGKTRNIKCGYCNSIFKSEITMGGPPKYCELCRPKVVAEQIRIRRHVAKAKRRFRCRGSAYEPVDPIKVFDRDKWKCHMCGTSTPKELRGSYLGNAPELDHIVTLADGGSHTYGNVACACRSCNQKKGAKSCGQIRIF